MSKARQVLIPNSGKTMQHPWRIVLAQSRGEILPEQVDEHYDYQRRRVQYVMERRQNRRLRGRFRSGGNPYRNPKRVDRLAKNGRLRRDLPAEPS